MSRSKEAFKLKRRRNWRNKAFAKLSNRSLADVPKNVPHNPRSDVLRRVLGMKPRNKGE